jgi:hypothetical protein
MLTNKRISNRIGTLIYEISNCIASVHDEEITPLDIELKNNIFKCSQLHKLCEYCETNKARTKDHFFPLVRNKFPTDACNDFWNIVPCCTGCNSSKGGATLNEWLVKKSPGNPFRKMDEETLTRITTKLREFEARSNERRYRKTFDTAMTSELIAYLTNVLETAQSKIGVIHKTTCFHRNLKSE